MDPVAANRPDLKERCEEERDNPAGCDSKQDFDRDGPLVGRKESPIQAQYGCLHQTYGHNVPELHNEQKLRAKPSAFQPKYVAGRMLPSRTSHVRADQALGMVSQNLQWERQRYS